MTGAKRNTNNGTASASRPEAAFEPRLQGQLLTSSLLAFLRRWNAYGYQLVQELAKAGLANFDSTTVYRTLRQLERAGLVSSFWDTSESGPARRMYSLTKTGEAFLDLWVDVFGRYQRILQTALGSLDNRERSVSTESPADREAEQEPRRRPARQRGRAASGRSAGERPGSSRRRGQNA